MFGYFFPVIFSIAKGLAIVLFSLILADIFMLFSKGKKLEFERELPDRFSNGDENDVKLSIQSHYLFSVYLQVLDEVPFQFQKRDSLFEKKIKPSGIYSFAYQLVPKQRGVYQFGKTNILVRTQLGLFQRKFVLGDAKEVKVYPSFLNLEKYEFLAISQNLKMGGQKRMRRIGQSTEFDHIKDYVLGDDPRFINWKASARNGDLKVNHYIDEKSQPIYCVIDKSRSMKMPFEGMTLLDYSINASLVLSNVAIKKGDRAGLITFEHEPSNFIPAISRNNQKHYLMESLHKIKTDFHEPDFSSLYTYTTQKVKQRSLMILFSNFESVYSLKRQLPYLKMLNRRHLLLFVFFKNTELDKVLLNLSSSIQDIYTKGIAYQLKDEKRAISNVLTQNGIINLYTSPQNLSVDVINKYIDLKTRRLL